MGFRIFIRTVIRKCRDTRLPVRLVLPDSEAAARKAVSLPARVSFISRPLVNGQSVRFVMNGVSSACSNVNVRVTVAKQ